MDAERGSGAELSESDQCCPTLFATGMGPLGVGDILWRRICFAQGAVCLERRKRIQPNFPQRLSVTRAAGQETRGPLSKAGDHVADDVCRKGLANEEFGFSHTRE